MQNVKLLLLFITLFFAASLNAQQWTSYTESNSGLADNGVGSIAFDTQGNKWFGTAGGVSKFDGSEWITYTESNSGLADNGVGSIAIDAQGNKWFGTSGGVSYFDGSNWTTYNTSNSGLINDSVYNIAIDNDGNKWFGTLNGVSKFDGSGWTTYSESNSGLANNNILSIAIDAQGNKWFGTFGGVSKFDGSNWTTYNTSNSGLSDNYVMSIAIDAQGNKWFGTYEISKFDGSVWTTYNITNSGLVNNEVYSIAIAAQGNKWFGTFGGVSKFDGSNWTTYNTSNSGLIIDSVYDIAIDNEGNKWFGTYYGGVSKFSDGGAGPLNIDNLISGTVYHDENGNGIQDTVEQGVADHLIKIEPGPYYTMTNDDGEFYFSRPEGTYTVSYIGPPYWTLMSDSLSYTIFLPDSTSIDSLAFGVKPKINTQDVGVYYTGQQPRPGFTINYWLNYKNWGTLTTSDTLHLKYDSLLTFVNSNVPAYNHTGNLMEWSYDTLANNEERQIQLSFEVPGIQYLDSSLTSTCWIGPLAQDTNLTNNYDTLNQVITGSYDPNDKLVSPEGVGAEGYVLHGEELTYTVRFQNTGTDTAFNIVVRDTLDTNMNLETFSLLASSHALNYDIRGQGVLSFEFDNIQLPDSNINEPESHGFVKYSVIPKQGLADYTEVTNKAYIYFDYNPPIITNEVLNTYVTEIPVNIDLGKESSGINIYPNPTGSNLFIQANSGIKKIEIININGQTLFYKTLDGNYGNQNNLNINLSTYPAGIYIVKVQTKNGVITEKLIIE